jgi:hypothetical protein
MTKVLTSILGVFFIFVFHSSLLAESAPRRSYGTELGLSSDPVEREIQIKRMYMDCDRNSEDTMLGADEAGFCSMVYETLLNDYFDGDFNAFLEWWKSEKTKP